MKLGYVIVYVPNVAATVLFYERAFGLKPRLVVDGGDYAEMETGATALAFANETFVASWGPGFRHNRPDEVPAGAEIALVSDDVAASFRQAVAATSSLACRTPRQS